MAVKDTKLEDELQIINKAWNHSDPESQRKWQKTIQMKFNDMKKREEKGA